MTIIFIILFCIIAFVFLGVGGWLLELLGEVIGFLFKGCLKSIGCLFWVFIIILLLCNL